MKGMPDKSVDLVLTDPPYGINLAKKGTTGGGSHRGKATDFGNQNWDTLIPSKEYFDEIFRVSKNQVIFGGNYMTEFLPPHACWIVWDKRCGITPERTFADGELAWTSFDSPMRIIRFLWDGMIQQDMKNKEVRHHPAIKPVEVISQIMTMFSNENDLILDPFGGSCTAAVAAENLKRRWICIEKEEKYVNICNERLGAMSKQMF
jgi:site-specific DNA-methyltransferase (adenine-specific)